MIKPLIVTIFAIATVAMVAGCATLGIPGKTGTSGANSAISSADQSRTSPQATPYSQPLMATGGDLVMLSLTRSDVAG